jgi:hypothetical protein
LFGPAEGPAQTRDRSLVIRPTRERPLSKEERAFNRALARVQALSRALHEEQRRLDRLLVFHASEVRPRVDRAGALRQALARALAPFLDDRRLTKRQRADLRQIVIAQLDDVLAHVETLDGDLEALFERLHGITRAQAIKDDIDEVRAGMAAMFDELGVDVPVPDLRPDMTEADMAAVAARLADDLSRAHDARTERARPARATKRQAVRLTEAQRREQLQKNCVGAVYRRLVKVLHPDLERDPAERERKSRIMQDVTAAYGRRDLHALLQLELEWLDHGVDATRLPEDTLRALTDVLKQQALELQAEVGSLHLHPRYAPLVVDGPFVLPLVIDGPREVQRLDSQAAQIESALARLSSDKALDEVRGAIRAWRDAERRDICTGRR